MSLYDMIEGAQDQKENNQLALIKLFAPLLKKYAYMLGLEDGYEILLVDFFQLIMTLDTAALRNRSDGVVVKYFEVSVHSSYIKHVKKFVGEDKHTVLINDQSEAQKSLIQNKQAISDDLFQVEYSDLCVYLTAKEYEVLMSVYVDGNSAAYLAIKLGVTRQNINQIKNRALQKLREHVNL